MMDLPSEKSSFYTRHNVSSSFLELCFGSEMAILVRKYLENEILHIAMIWPQNLIQ